MFTLDKETGMGFNIEQAILDNLKKSNLPEDCGYRLICESSQNIISHKSTFLTICFVHCSARIVLDGNKFNASAGNYIMVKESCPFSTQVLPLKAGEIGIFILDFSKDFFDELYYLQISDCPIFYDFFRPLSGEKEYLVFDNTENELPAWSSRLLLYEASKEYVGKKKAILACLVIFLTQLHRTHQNHLLISKSSMMTTYPFKAGRYLKYMADNYRTVTLNSMAKEFGYTPAYFSTLFKKMVWTTFSEKLMELKLEQAKSLLTTTSQSIEGITQLVGFTDKSYFHRCFKKKFGLTPGAYRKLHT